MRGWLEARGRHAYLGVVGQMIHIDPPSQIVAVKLSSWPDFLNDTVRRTTIRALEALWRALTGSCSLTVQAMRRGGLPVRIRFTFQQGLLGFGRKP